MEVVKIGLFSDADVNEVERVLLRYLNPKLKRHEITKEQMEAITFDNVTGFHHFWRHAKSNEGNRAVFYPPIWHDEKQKRSIIGALKSHRGLEGDTLGSLLGWAVGGLRYIIEDPLNDPDDYKAVIGALAQVQDLEVFYRYIQKHLIYWNSQIRKQPELIKQHPAGYKKMRELMT